MVRGEQRWWLPPNRYGSRVFGLRSGNTRKVVRIISDKLSTVLFYWWSKLDYIPGGWREQGIETILHNSWDRYTLGRKFWARETATSSFLVCTQRTARKLDRAHEAGIGSHLCCREDRLKEHCTLATNWKLRSYFPFFVTNLIKVVEFRASCAWTRLLWLLLYNLFIYYLCMLAGFWGK